MAIENVSTLKEDFSQGVDRPFEYTVKVLDYDDLEQTWNYIKNAKNIDPKTEIKLLFEGGGTLQDLWECHVDMNDVWDHTKKYNPKDRFSIFQNGEAVEHFIYLSQDMEGACEFLTTRDDDELAPLLQGIIYYLKLAIHDCHEGVHNGTSIDVIQGFLNDFEAVQQRLDQKQTADNVVGASPSTNPQ